jgi:hypothetical protein
MQGVSVTVRLTPEQARALGLDTKARRKTTRKTAEGKYHTRCNCGEEFTTAAAENRHVQPGHQRFTLVLNTEEP